MQPFIGEANADTHAAVLSFKVRPHRTVPYSGWLCHTLAGFVAGCSLETPALTHYTPAARNSPLLAVNQFEVPVALGF